jgi:cellulose synthase/poly-beta-1,6-N-acetylglucosamine synthase-like glycosyltransferase
MGPALLTEVLLCALAVAALLPLSLLLAQVLLALPAYRARELPATRRPRAAVVVPAHDEQTLIGATLRAIAPQLAPGDRLLVVADTCSDDTAAIAGSIGAEVIERHDAARSGKGFALDFAIRYLERAPPEVVLVVDADCDVGAGAIERLARTCLQRSRPVQALYLMRSADGASVKTRVGEFAWLVKNHVRPLGYQRLGLPCQLMGSGMAFPWRAIRHARLASGHIVEDLVLGIELARAGSAPRVCPEAQVTSALASSAEAARTQRRRWEHGHLAALVTHAPPLLVEAIRHANRDLLALVVDLCVPPLALLTGLVLALLAGSALHFAATAGALPLWLAGASAAMLALAVLAAWARHGRRVISLASLAYAPLYALSKVPLYVGFLVKRQVEWVRTRREKW